MDKNARTLEFVLSLSNDEDFVYFGGNRCAVANNKGTFHGPFEGVTEPIAIPALFLRSVARAGKVHGMKVIEREKGLSFCTGDFELYVSGIVGARLVLPEVPVETDSVLYDCVRNCLTNTRHIKVQNCYGQFFIGEGECMSEMTRRITWEAWVPTGALKCALRYRSALVEFSFENKILTVIVDGLVSQIKEVQNVRR